MPLIGFTVFRDKIENGEKRQTIRLKRRRAVKKGDALYLYWRLRTKQCQLIMKTVCTEAFTVKWRDIENDEDIAKRDGFKTLQDFQRWFSRYKPSPETEFDIIRW